MHGRRVSECANPIASVHPESPQANGVSERIRDKSTSLRIGASPDIDPESFNIFFPGTVLIERSARTFNCLNPAASEGE
jgi:hypothetical protein